VSASTLADPRRAQAFRFIACDYDVNDGTARLRYAFDDGPELVETIMFTPMHGQAPDLAPARAAAFASALRLLHLIAGISYYKAGVPAEIRVEGAALDADTAEFLREVYFHGLGEFAYQNKLDLRERIRFPANWSIAATSRPPLHGEGGGGDGVLDALHSGHPIPTQTLPLKGRASERDPVASSQVSLNLPRRTLLPIGGGKDSLVSVEICKSINEPVTVACVGDSELIAACAQRTDLPMLNIKRRLAPELFEYNRRGAYNGHIPVTAINSAILVCAAILYGYDAIAFSNESSASSATLEYDGQPVNHQWSKSLDFERGLRTHIQSHIAADLDYFSLLRPWSEVAVARAFAKTSRYDDVFSSCNRNFRILGKHASERWCGQCPKCHFVFLALAPFMPKLRLLGIFGNNLLDNSSLAPSFDALLEFREHKPFECVGEGRESRAAMYALSRRAEWREDALVARFVDEILPQLDACELVLEPLLAPMPEHFLPARFAQLLPAAG
jgi:hypothetical protein